MLADFCVANFVCIRKLIKDFKLLQASGFFIATLCDFLLKILVIFVTIVA
jgi:hypothetical protein